MRYIGSKAALLDQIEQVIRENTDPNARVFCDIFAGTGAVARHFKPKYQIIANDFLHFSYVMQQATIVNNRLPEFSALKQVGILDPFAFLEETKLTMDSLEEQNRFITQTYSPAGKDGRMYLSAKNALRIDFIRTTIQSWRDSGLLTDGEYYYLLAGLIEGVPYVSNITGTYGAYLKHWDKRAYKDFEMVRLEVEDNGFENRACNQDANALISQIEGDILYLDPPYNNRQYAPNYHLLETISRYDRPQVSGVTGMRPYGDTKSAFCRKGEAAGAFEELVEKAKFESILLSYSTDGLMTSQEMEAILKRHGIPESFRRYDIPYRKYKSKIVSPDDALKEYIYFIRKRVPKRKTVSLPGRAKAAAGGKKPPAKKYLKSPLNYIGGKYRLLPQILPLFPPDIATFVDLFSGGANVAINVCAERILCNDINEKIISLFQTLQTTPVEQVLERIEENIRRWGLSKTNEEGFLQFRDYYNQTGDPIDLYTLSCYSFNYQFRFNNSLEYNNPFGRNRSQFSQRMRGNLIAFMEKLQHTNIQFRSQDFIQFDLSSLGPQDMIYCDPPYLITTGTYNDGNRGFKDWGPKEERQLLELLDRADQQGIRFALSNVMEHKGQKNQLLLDWSSRYRVVDLSFDYSNSSYNTQRGRSREVLILND